MDNQREREIWKSYPVLWTAEFKTDLERWNHFSNLAAQKFDDPLSKEAAKWIARQIEKTNNQ